MSLTDALLLDSYPFEIWIAYRTDDNGGSGTLNDPYNASSRFAAPITATALTNTGGDSREATLTLPSGHGLNNYDVVKVSGVTGTGASMWNGTFSIYSKDATSAKYYMSGIPSDVAAGTVSVSKVTEFRFDSVMMNSVPANSKVHLGPAPADAPFLTKGYADGVAGGWELKNGICVAGSGMGSTFLKLVSATTTDKQYFTIGHGLTTGSPSAPNPMHFSEICDLTIDCNITKTTSVACGAIRLLGDHVKVHRVRAINWGTTSTTKPCFVIAVLTADRSGAGTLEVINAGIDRCVAESPLSYGVSSPITVFHVGGKQDAPTNEEAFGRACYIRNCLVDCGALSSPLDADIRGLSMGWCRAGIIEGNQVHNTKIGGPYQDKASTREMIVRNNSYKNVLYGPYWNCGLLNSNPPGTVGISSLNQASGVVTATTSGDHKFSQFDRVKVAGTTSGAGIFPIIEIPATNKFKYAYPGTLPTGTITAQKAFGVSNLLIERNIIELAPATSGEAIAIHVHDGKSDTVPDTTLDSIHREVVVRENRVRYLNGQFETTFVGVGIRVCGAENTIIRDNVIECYPANPLKNFRCGTVKYFNNKTPAGALIQGYNGVASTKYSELETEAEDALLLTLI